MPTQKELLDCAVGIDRRLVGDEPAAPAPVPAKKPAEKPAAKKAARRPASKK